MGAVGNERFTLAESRPASLCVTKGSLALYSRMNFVEWPGVFGVLFWSFHRSGGVGSGGFTLAEYRPSRPTIVSWRHAGGLSRGLAATLYRGFCKCLLVEVFYVTLIEKSAN